jgi:DNA-binding SARP family transcriptional activator
MEVRFLSIAVRHSLCCFFGRANLRRTLTVLNGHLSSGWVQSDGDHVLLGRDILWVDVTHFEHCQSQCRAHGHGPDEVCPDCLAPLAEAVSTYGGDFLAGFSLPDSEVFNEWQTNQAESLRSALSRALDRLVEAEGSRRVGQTRVTRYRFRHALFQTYLYANLDPGRLAILHEAVGDALEEIHTGEPDTRVQGIPAL